MATAVSGKATWPESLPGINPESSTNQKINPLGDSNFPTTVQVNSFIVLMEAGEVI
jgi:hypothetical protein